MSEEACATVPVEAGPSRNYYSSSSSHSSSAESIQNMSSSGSGSSGSGKSGSVQCRSKSTLENGDLSLFTFLMSKYISADLSHLPEAVGSCVHKQDCHCTGFRNGSNSNLSFGMDPYGGLKSRGTKLGVTGGGGGRGNCSCNCTLGKLCHSSRLGERTSSYSSLLSSNLDGYLIRSLERGGNKIVVNVVFTPEK